jgi:hypothetical protein
VPYLKRAILSHDATTWARQQDVGNTPAKFLLLMLADYAGSDYSCWPGQTSLSKLTEMSERTIRRATELLVEQGLIRVFYRYRDNNSRRSCRYQLLIDGPETELPETVDWRSMKQAVPDSLTDTPPDTVTAPTGQAVQTYRSESPVIPSKDPSVEPLLPIPGAARTAKATRIPDDFMPDEKMRAWFVGENLQLAIPNPRAEHENFCDYWRAKAGADARKLDWPATWRRWMRTAASRSNYRPTNGSAHSKTNERVIQGLSLAAKYEEQGL